MEKSKKTLSHVDIFSSLPRPSSFSPRKAWEEAAWNALMARLHRIASVRAFAETCAMLTTTTERRMMARRAVALSLLREGFSYRAIGRELWNSPHTTSAIKKSAAARRYISRWSRTKKLREEKTAKAFVKEWEKRNAPGGYYRRTKYGSRWTPS